MGSMTSAGDIDVLGQDYGHRYTQVQDTGNNTEGQGSP